MSKLAIDPGANGGFAWRDGEGIVQAEPMPDGMTAIVDWLRKWRVAHPNGTAVCENVGGYVPGNSGPGAVTFAAHCATLDCALYCIGISADRDITPHKWQKHYGFSVSKWLPDGYKSMPETTKEERKAKSAVRSAAVRMHKNEIREQMQRSCPHLRVTLKTGDALALLGYAEGAR
jgi:hypothetical protein